MDGQTYVVIVRIPYEGLHEAIHGTIDEIKEWLKTTSYHHDDMQVFSTDAPDIYDLVEE